MRTVHKARKKLVRANPRGVGFWEAQFLGRVRREGAAARRALAVDPALWRSEPRFGVAGGPFVHRLTQEGLDRAAAVAGIPLGTLATISRVVALGGLPVEDRQGSKVRLLVSSKELSALHTLVSHGYVRWEDNMTRAMLTDEGARRLADALEEQARLLGRVRVAHPINRETGELRDVATAPKSARQNPGRRSRRGR